MPSLLCGFGDFFFEAVLAGFYMFAFWSLYKLGAPFLPASPLWMQWVMEAVQIGDVLPILLIGTVLFSYLIYNTVKIAL